MMNMRDIIFVRSRDSIVGADSDIKRSTNNISTIYRKIYVGAIKALTKFIMSAR